MKNKKYYHCECCDMEFGIMAGGDNCRGINIKDLKIKEAIEGIQINDGPAREILDATKILIIKKLGL